MALRIQGVGKKYRLGQIGGESIQQELKSWWYKVRRKEDPNLKIGTDLSVIGQTFYALKDVTFDVERGEVVGLLGRNGAGKSTLLKLISRITAPSEGVIEIWGRVASMLEVGTGFHLEMTGRENVYMNGAILGMSRGEIAEKMDSITEFSEIGPFLDTPVKRYSSGMYVKLAFSVASHLSSEIMIMDEVLAVGDVTFQNKCIRKMREEAEKSGKTILYVSHNMDTVRRLCKKSIVLDRGRVVHNGSVEDGIQAYTAVKSRMDLSYDLSNEDRSASLSLTQKMMCVEISKNLLSSSESLVFRLKCFSMAREGNLGLRIEVRTSSEMVAGSAASNRFTAAEGNYMLEASFPVSALAPGRYDATLVLCRFDLAGNGVVIDAVRDAFSFEIEREGVDWDTSRWGSVRFSGLDVTVV